MKLIFLIFLFCYYVKAFEWGDLFQWWNPSPPVIKEPEKKEEPTESQDELMYKKIRLQSKVYESVLREKYIYEKKILQISELMNTTNPNITQAMKDKIIEPFHIQLLHWKLLDKASWLGLRYLDQSLNDALLYLEFPFKLQENLGALNSTSIKTEIDSYQNNYLQSLSTKSGSFLSEFQTIIVTMKLTTQKIQELAGKKKKQQANAPSNSTAVEEPIAGSGTGSKIVDNILENVSEIADKIEESKENLFKDFHTTKHGHFETVLKLDEKNEHNHEANNSTSNNPGKTLVDTNNNQYVLMKPADLTMLYEDSKLIQEIIFLICFSFICGMFFELIGLPSFFGYVIVGIWLGPSGINFIKNLIQIGTFAQFGVYLLLFLLGLEFSFERIVRVWKLAFFGTSLYAVVVTFGITMIGVFFTAGVSESIIVGAAISLSSTAVALKCLGHEGAKKSYGNPMIAILIVQDVFLCLLLAIFPSIRQGDWLIVKDIGLVLVKIGALIGLFVVLHFTLLRFFLKLLTVSPALEEMYTLAAVFFCFGMAQVSEYLAVSMELGCFISGVFLGLQKNTVQKTINRIQPIADLFSILFFNSIGLHVNPQLLLGEADVLVLLSLLVVILKFLSLFLILSLGFRYSLKNSSIISLGLAHISEFSFVIASKAKTDGLISREVYYLIVGMTSITLILVPLLWKLFYFFDWLRKYIKKKSRKLDYAPVDNSSVVDVESTSENTFYLHEIKAASYPSMKTPSLSGTEDESKVE